MEERWPAFELRFCTGNLLLDVFRRRQLLGETNLTSIYIIIFEGFQLVARGRLFIFLLQRNRRWIQLWN